MWVGPYRVEKCVSENVYSEKDLNEKSLTVHSSRVAHYAGASFIPSKELRAIFVLNENGMVVERLIELKFYRGKHWILVQWKGSAEKINSF